MKYYFINNKKQFGPFELDDLKKIEITFDTFVWREGLDNWTKAGEIEELRILIQSLTPPPIPGIENNEINLNLTVKREKNKEVIIENKIKKENYKKIIAKEIVFSVKILLIALITSIIFYIILGIYKNSVKNKFCNYTFNVNLSLAENEKSSLINKIVQRDDLIVNQYYHGINKSRSNEIEKLNVILNDFDILMQESDDYFRLSQGNGFYFCINDKYKNFGFTNILYRYWAFYVFLLLFLIPILFRYFFILIRSISKWVIKYSRK